MQSVQAVTEEQPRVLVIDDEEIVHASLKRIFSRLGCEVETALSAISGLSLLNKKRFNLIMVDLMMPEMNGIQFLKALKGRDLRLPVIMVTGYPTIQTAVEALRLGAVDYITKPFTRKEILSPVQKALSMKGEVTPQANFEDRAVKKEDLVPGSTVVLPRHSSAQFQRDGTFHIGIERSFLETSGKIAAVTAAKEMGFIEQGYIGIYLRNEDGQDHGVSMPLSGQVVALNSKVINNPSLLDSDSWVMRIIPSHLDEELGRLAGRRRH
jgi:DNA-binding response OmpR family regulator